MFRDQSARMAAVARLAGVILLVLWPAAALEAKQEDFAKFQAVCESFTKDDTVQHGCVTNAEGAWVVTAASDVDCVASGTFIDSAQTVSNFGKLRVVTSASYSDLDQSFAAGFLEGYLTAARIYDHHFNLKGYFVQVLNESAALENALDWLVGQEVWANSQIAAAPEDPYWQLLGLVQAQFNGLVEGYQARARAAAAAGPVGGKGGNADVAVPWLERRDIMFLNSNGDVYDIMDAMEAGYAGGDNESQVDPDQQQQEGGAESGSGSTRLRHGRRVPKWAEVDPSPVRMALKLGLQGKCSALIKVTGDLGELLLGHSTHDSFTAMTRIYKHYDFSNLNNAAVAAKKVSFSSYPGELFSDDDFYLLSSGLAVMETTNHIYVSDVYAPLAQQCVLSWQRLRLANWMAASGEEWVELFGRQNSGTYNNQYMILDTKRFKPHTELQPGLLWVTEQLPGLIKAADMTDELSRGYWPSYNVAYFPEVYDAAGYPDMIERLAQEGAKKYAFSIRLLKYQIAPRAAIFRRDQGQVDSLEGLKHLMRYNDYKNDPYAEGHPVGAICARGDLAGGDDALAKGCYDSKVTSVSLIARMESEVVSGPTAQGQPPFSWSDPRWTGLPHRGMPESFDFSFERMSPRDLPTLVECRQLEKQQQVQQQQQEVESEVASDDPQQQVQQVEQQQQQQQQQEESHGSGSRLEQALMDGLALLLPRKAGIAAWRR